LRGGGLLGTGRIRLLRPLVAAPWIAALGV
jgi:hypothetical protein